jgi:hypothetical protein
MPPLKHIFPLFVDNQHVSLGTINAATTIFARYVQTFYPSDPVSC